MNSVNTFVCRLFALCLGLVGTAMAEPAPLSCEMQRMLNGTTAILRDQGVSRLANPLGKNPDSELTKKEVKEILDRVYIARQNKTPKEIEAEVYAACKGKSSSAKPKDDNCVSMATMAADIARLRDAGATRTAVEERLRQDVSDQAELGIALVVVRLVYQAQGTPDQLDAAVRRKCRDQLK